MQIDDCELGAGTWRATVMRACSRASSSSKAVRPPARAKRLSLLERERDDDEGDAGGRAVAGTYVVLITREFESLTAKRRSVPFATEGCAACVLVDSHVMCSRTDALRADLLRVTGASNDARIAPRSREIAQLEARTATPQSAIALGSDSADSSLVSFETSESTSTLETAPRRESRLRELLGPSGRHRTSLKPPHHLT